MLTREERRPLINEYGAFNNEAQSIGYRFRNRLKDFISDNSLEYLRLDELENLLISELQFLISDMRLTQSRAIKRKKG